MENNTHGPGDVEIVKEADINIIDDGNNNDQAMLKVLKNEISHLKASNASLKIQLQYFRENYLPNVLLVDDNHETVQVITGILSDYNVINTGNGIEALSMLRKMGNVGSDIQRIDTILLEVNLPGMSGFTLCRELKKNIKLNIPIIFCSANNTKKDVIKAISFGADDYIIKPFQEKALLEKVGKWTKKRLALNRTR
ncbi:MAG: Sensor histidine kinase RcsC [Candidatus Scalindua arabica]|uniref:Sensor histidine kinase RcsC n=1 Tax=Candidatus Scalindua arabica TaxID=1127984 RepID=A0A942A5P4_9BACT|nr:Sensor histidine kinase RcsC [Candidatus Scalindua arabica]